MARARNSGGIPKDNFFSDVFADEFDGIVTPIVGLPDAAGRGNPTLPDTIPVEVLRKALPDRFAPDEEAVSEIAVPGTEDNIGYAKPAGRGKDKTIDSGDGTGGSGRGKKNKDTSESGGDTTDGDTTGGTGSDTTGGDTTGGDTTGGDTTGGDTTGGDTPTGDFFVSGLDTPGGFNIEIDFQGTWTESYKQGFYNASEFLSDIITGDLTNVNGIDDVRITATLTSIDGTGNLAGWGGVSSARSGSYLPSQGYMRFDSADAPNLSSSSIWEDLIVHEMLHSMGFGVSWNAMGLVETIDGGLRFTGQNAIDAYNSTFADIAANDPNSLYGVPIEMDGGSGTAGVHWDDTTFGNETMTGYLNWGNHFSDLTIAALEDMGYETVWNNDLLVA